MHRGAVLGGFARTAKLLVEMVTGKTRTAAAFNKRLFQADVVRVDGADLADDLSDPAPPGAGCE